MRIKQMHCCWMGTSLVCMKRIAPQAHTCLVKSLTNTYQPCNTSSLTWAVSDLITSLAALHFAASSPAIEIASFNCFVVLSNSTSWSWDFRLRFATYQYVSQNTRITTACLKFIEFSPVKNGCQLIINIRNQHKDSWNLLSS